MAYGIVSTQSVNSSGATLHLTVGDVKNAKAYGGNYDNSLTWTDPSDVIVEGSTLAAWAGTLVVRKVGTAPADSTDGTVILDSKVRDAHKSAAYVDEVPNNNVNYYYRFFPYTVDGEITNGSTVSARPTEVSVTAPSYTSALGTLVYNSASQDAPISDIDTSMITLVSGGSGVNAGTYTAVYRLASKLYKWADGTFTDKTYEWSIARADASIIVPNTGKKITTGEYILDAGDTQSLSLPITVVGDGTLSLSYNTSNLYVRASLVNNTLNLTRTSLEEAYQGSVQVTLSTNQTTNYNPATVTITVTSQNYQYMTVVIDQKESAPDICCYYPADASLKNDALNMTPVYSGMTYEQVTLLSSQSNRASIESMKATARARAGAWDEFFGHYPCILQNDTVNGGVKETRLNPDDFRYAYGEDSTTADPTPIVLTGGTGTETVYSQAGDCPEVMVCFPRHGLKIWTQDHPDRAAGNQDLVYISMTDNPDDPDYEYMAHQRGNTQKDKFYLGVYMAYATASVAAGSSSTGQAIPRKLHSWKGRVCTVSQTIGTFRTQAQANGKPDGKGGSGWDQHGYYQLVYLISMYILKYAHLNSQNQIGQGFVNGNSAAHVTGTDSTATVASGVYTNNTETWGMDTSYIFDNAAGDTVSGSAKDQVNGKKPMKLFGIEDLWGNLWSWIDGLWSDNNRVIWTATENFNDSASQSSVYNTPTSSSFIDETSTAYVNRGSTGLTSNISGYLTRIQGDTHKAFLAKAVGGSATTYFCDSTRLSNRAIGVWLGVNYGAHDQYQSSPLLSGIYIVHTYTQQEYHYEQNTGNMGDVSSRLMYL